MFNKNIIRRGEKYSEYYNNEKQISIKILNEKLENPEKMYIKVKNNNFYIEKVPTGYEIKAEFEKKYKPNKSSYIYTFEEDEN